MKKAKNQTIETALHAEQIRLMDEQVRLAYTLQPETAEELAALDAADQSETWSDWIPQNDTR